MASNKQSLYDNVLLVLTKMPSWGKPGETAMQFADRLTGTTTGAAGR